MLTPNLSYREAQTYAAIPLQLIRESIGEKVPVIYEEIASWLSNHQIEITGAPIIRYMSINYATSELEVHVGFPVSVTQLPEHPRIGLYEIPSGTYATLVHEGVYTELFYTTAALLAWGQRRIGWKITQPAGSNFSIWAGRVEHYLVSPPNETNPENWITEIAILTTIESE